jgi:hypothetical protein
MVDRGQISLEDHLGAEAEVVASQPEGLTFMSLFAAPVCS